MKPYTKSLKNGYGIGCEMINLAFVFIGKKPLLSYIVDFYCPKAKLVIELDGSQHYEPEHQANDKIRDAELASLGLTVLRFDNYRVITEIDSVIEEIWLYLQSVGE